MQQSQEQEPVFNAKPYHLALDLLEEWLFVLGTENTENTKSCQPSRGNLNQGMSVELIFHLCTFLKQPPQVKYHATELFDHFMVKYVRHLWQRVRQSSTRCSRDGRTLWKCVTTRLKERVVLRMLSCIQIASKLHCHPKNVLSVATMKQVLHRTGRNASITDILKSELKILDTVAFKVNVITPLVYLETLLEVLGHNDTMVNIDALYRVSLHLLDIVYLRKKEIYLTLFRRTTSKQKVEFSSKVLQPIVNDFMFMCSAVVCCAAYYLDQCNYIKVVKQLQLITHIPDDELMDFIIVLVTLVNGQIV